MKKIVIILIFIFIASFLIGSNFLYGGYKIYSASNLRYDTQLACYTVYTNDGIYNIDFNKLSNQDNMKRVMHLIIRANSSNTSLVMRISKNIYGNERYEFYFNDEAE